MTKTSKNAAIYLSRFSISLHDKTSLGMRMLRLIKTDQTERMLRLIWIFAGHPPRLIWVLVLSPCGSVAHMRQCIKINGMAETDILPTAVFMCSITDGKEPHYFLRFVWSHFVIGWWFYYFYVCVISFYLKKATASVSIKRYTSANGLAQSDTRCNKRVQERVALVLVIEFQVRLSRLMTKPTKWLRAQRRLRSAWASAQSDQSLRCALSGVHVPKDVRFLHADSEDPDQTGRMPRLIWVLSGRTATLLVLTWSGSIVFLV